jgi:serine/threonine-protein kinase HipA
MDAAGQWRFAPAYDLTFSNTAHGHHSTTVAGESKAPTTANIRQLAQIFGVENIAPVIEQVRYALNNWAVYAREYGITKASQRDISQAIKDRDK